MGVLVASYKELVPQCAILAELYLLVPSQSAVVRRSINHDYVITNPGGEEIVIKTFGRKSIMKYCKSVFSGEEVEQVLAAAASAWSGKLKV